MNKNLRIAMLVMVFWAVADTPTRCQVLHQLTLGQSIETAIKNGLVARDVETRYLAARNRAASAQRALWTSVSLSAAAPDYSQSLSQQFNPATGSYEYYQLQTTNYRGSLVINQPLTLTGGTLRFSQSLLGRAQTSGLSSSNTATNDYFGDYAFELQQPILTTNMHRLNAQRADLAYEQAETDFLNSQLDLVYRVTESFYTLVQQLQRLGIVKEQVKQNEESYNAARSKFTGGLIPEVEVLQSDVDLASSRNDSLNTERELARAKNDLRLLLGIAPQDNILPIGDLTYAPLLLDSSKAVTFALQYRSETLRADRDIQMREIDVASAKAQNGFRIDLTARYGGSKTDTLFRDVFHDLNRSRSASLTFSIPIFDWGRNGLNVEAAEVELRNAAAQRDYTRQQVQQETIDLLNRIRVAQSRIEVLQKSVSVAQQSYDISLQRFRNGTINRNDLAQAQQRLTAAKLNSLNALIDYRLGIADLTRKTHWDFENNTPVKPIIQVHE